MSKKTVKILSLIIAIFIISSCSDEEDNNSAGSNNQLYMNFKIDGNQINISGILWNSSGGGYGDVDGSVDANDSYIRFSYGPVGTSSNLITYDLLEELEGQTLSFTEQSSTNFWAYFNAFYEGDDHTSNNASLSSSANANSKMKIIDVEYHEQKNTFGEITDLVFITGTFNCTVGTDTKSYTITDGSFRVLVALDVID